MVTLLYATKTPLKVREERAASQWILTNSCGALGCAQRGTFKSPLPVLPLDLASLLCPPTGTAASTVLSLLPSEGPAALTWGLWGGGRRSRVIPGSGAKQGAILGGVWQSLML